MTKLELLKKIREEIDEFGGTTSIAYNEAIFEAVTILDKYINELVGNTSDVVPDEKIQEAVDTFCKPGWMNISKFHMFMMIHGIVSAGPLPRHNKTDGEYHMKYRHVSGNTFEFHGNDYVAPTWEPLVRWVASYPELKLELEPHEEY